MAMPESNRSSETHADSAPLLDLSAGALIGFGLSGTSFMVLLAAFGKLLPPVWRSLAFGFGTAAGSFGQFLYSPLAVALMDSLGWQQTLTIFGVAMLLVLPLSSALRTPSAASMRSSESRTRRTPIFVLPISTAATVRSSTGTDRR